MRGKGGADEANACVIGPFPLLWLIPDPEYKPRAATMALYKDHEWESLFSHFGPLNSVEAVFQTDRKFLLLLK